MFSLTLRLRQIDSQAIERITDVYLATKSTVFSDVFSAFEHHFFVDTPFPDFICPFLGDISVARSTGTDASAQPLYTRHHIRSRGFHKVDPILDFYNVLGTIM
jgi:hypothetical protein